MFRNQPASDGVLALLMLAQLGADAGQQHREAERLGHVVVGAGIEAEDRIRIAIRRRQHDDRALDAVLAQKLADLAPVHIGKADVEQDQVVMGFLDDLQGFGATASLRRLEFVMHGQLLGEGGHESHLTIAGFPIEPISKATFYFAIVVLVAVDLLQSRYQTKLAAQRAAAQYGTVPRADWDGAG